MRRSLRDSRVIQLPLVMFAIIVLCAVGLQVEKIFASGRRSAGFAADAFHWSTAAIEWFIAAWVLSGVSPKWARRAAIGLIVVFILVASTRGLRGEEDCGCFGRIHSRPWQTFVVDVLLLGCVIVPHRMINRTISRPPALSGTVMRALKVAGITGVILATPLLSFMTVAPPPWLTHTMLEPANTLDPDAWAGKRFPLFGRLGRQEEGLAQGKWNVFIVDGDCERCRSFLAHADFRDLSAYGEADGRARAPIVIDVGRSGRAAAVLSKSTRTLSLGGEFALTDGPFVVALNRGIVESVRRLDVGD